MARPEGLEPPTTGFESAVEGTAPSGTTEATIGVPPGSEFYLVAAENSTCGAGPKR